MERSEATHEEIRRWFERSAAERQNQKKKRKKTNLKIKKDFLLWKHI